MAKEEKKAKTKRPTAQKRDETNLKRQLQNKSFKSQARTTVRSFNEALKANNKEGLSQKLNEIYSLADKGVKRGIFKQNKANRIKARAVKKVLARSA